MDTCEPIKSESELDHREHHMDQEMDTNNLFKYEGIPDKMEGPSPIIVKPEEDRDQDVKFPTPLCVVQLDG